MFITVGFFDISWTNVFLTVFLLLILVYYKYVFAPYAKFPSYRADIRILLWLFKRKPLTTMAIRKGFEALKGHESEGVLAFWVGYPILFIHSKEFVQRFSKEPAAVDKPKLYEITEFVFGKGLFTGNGELWKKRTQITRPVLRSTMLRDKVPIMNKNAKACVEQFRKLNELVAEPVDLLKEFVLRTFLDSNLGLNGHGNEASDVDIRRIAYLFHKLTDYTIQRATKPWLCWDLMMHLTSSGRRALKMRDELHGLIQKIVERIKENRILYKESGRVAEVDPEYHDPEPKFIGENLIEKNLKDPSFTVKQVVEELTFLTFAGFDTSAVTLMWCLFLLGCHQDIQQKAYEEVVSVTDGDVQYSDLCELKYLECVLKETLRFYPTVPFYFRHLTKDVWCGKYKFPKNSIIGINIFMLHGNSEIYPNPKKFDPERFFNADPEMNSFFLPFAEGIRSCPGKHFAMMEMKIFLAHFLRTFKVTSVDRIEDVKMRLGIVMAPQKPLRLQFIPRETQHACKN